MTVTVGRHHPSRGYCKMVGVGGWSCKRPPPPGRRDDWHDGNITGILFQSLHRGYVFIQGTLHPVWNVWGGGDEGSSLFFSIASSTEPTEGDGVTIHLPPPPRAPVPRDVSRQNPPSQLIQHARKILHSYTFSSLSLSSSLIVIIVMKKEGERTRTTQTHSSSEVQSHPLLEDANIFHQNRYSDPLMTTVMTKNDKQ